jgi:hypothetical protein
MVRCLWVVGAALAGGMAAGCGGSTDFDNTHPARASGGDDAGGSAGESTGGSGSDPIGGSGGTGGSATGGGACQGSAACDALVRLHEAATLPTAL